MNTYYKNVKYNQDNKTEDDINKENYMKYGKR